MPRWSRPVSEKALRISVFAILILFFTFESFAQKENRESIKIGLLLTDNKQADASNGAEISIKNANAKGGYKGIQFSLITKTMEGPWGNGSKQAVSLIFQDKVVALLGSCDGRNAHLVEQAATRSMVVFISAWSGDPTLAKAFVPWFFNCASDYDRQSELLVQKIYGRMNLKSLITVVDDSYDSNIAFESFRKRSGVAELQKTVFGGTDDDCEKIVSEIRANKADGIMLFIPVNDTRKINLQLKKSGIKIPVFCTSGPLPAASEFDDIIYLSQNLVPGKEEADFKRQYQENYGSLPGQVAALAFDGMNLIIEAIKSGGTERENIQEALAKINIKGVTGTISFDGMGRRKESLYFMQIINGVAVTIDKN